MPVDIALEDYEFLCDVAREQNEYVPAERVRAAAPAASDAKGDRPGDEYNRRAAWADVLGPHGWAVAYTRGEATYWTRPGKSRGVSASTGFCKSDARGDLLYVWSANAGPFEPDAAYDKFGAAALLEHGGDFSAAAARLRSLGYSKPQPDVYFAEPTAPPDEADDVAGIDDLKRAGAEIRWVWPGWIQNGVVTAVAAQGGTGKTRLMADLVRRVRHGLPWPDGTPMTLKAGKTVALWVVADNHHDEMVSLCEAFGIADCVKVNASKADPYGGVTLDAVEEFAALEKRVKATRPAFVAVDTAGNATDKNLSRQEDAKGFYQPLQLIARRQLTAVCVLTHLNAGGKVLGRRALEKVRVCVRMSARDGDHREKRRLEVIKSNSMKPAPLGVQMGGGGNEYDTDPPPPPEEEGQPRPVVGKTEPDAPKGHQFDWRNALDRVVPSSPPGLTRDEVNRKIGEANTSHPGVGANHLELLTELDTRTENGIYVRTGRGAPRNPFRYHRADSVPVPEPENPTRQPEPEPESKVRDDEDTFYSGSGSGSRSSNPPSGAGTETPVWWAELRHFVRVNGPMTVPQMHALSGYPAVEIEAGVAHYEGRGLLVRDGAGVVDLPEDERDAV